MTVVRLLVRSLVRLVEVRACLFNERDIVGVVDVGTVAACCSHPNNIQRFLRMLPPAVTVGVMLHSALCFGVSTLVSLLVFAVVVVVGGGPTRCINTRSLGEVASDFYPFCHRFVWLIVLG